MVKNIAKRSTIGNNFLNEIDNDELIDHLNRKAYVRRIARARVLKKII